MLDVVKRPLARDDIKGIWHYTFERWGEVQADEVLRKLDPVLQSRAANLGLGASRAHIRTGYRALHVGHHFIYYMRTHSVIRVMRILHERMDPGAHV
jgi:toxin ParE1/3/4